MQLATLTAEAILPGLAPEQTAQVQQLLDNVKALVAQLTPKPAAAENSDNVFGNPNADVVMQDNDPDMADIEAWWAARPTGEDQ